MRRRARGARPGARAPAFGLARSTSRPTTRCFTRYLERIPVVALDGEELFDFFVDEERLARDALEWSRHELQRGREQREPQRLRPARSADRLSLGVAARLSRYLQVLTQARKMGKETISSQELSEYTHVNSTQIRRDLSGFGKFGKRGVGYNVDSLVSQIRKILRTSGQHNIALFGAGHLGPRHRLLGHLRRPRLPRRGDLRHRPLQGRRADQRRRPSATSRTSSRSSTRRTSSSACSPSRPPRRRTLADQLVDAGVKIIFNYSEALLQVPPEVTVHTSSPAVDLLYALYFYLT